MRQAQRAQALVWLTLMVPVFIAMAGLAIDGAVLLSARRDLQSVADGAARAGATQVDLERFRLSDGSDVQLEPAQALVTTQTYLNTQLAREFAWEAHPTTHIQIQPRRVHVVVQAVLRTAFLRIVNVDNVPVDASADADVRFGVRAGDGT